MPKVTKIIIEGVTPSQNIFDRTHRWGKADIRDEWYVRVRKATGGQRNPPERSPVFLNVVRVSERLIDDANAPAGFKYMIDALVKYGYAVDDSRKWMRLLYDQRLCEPDEEPHMEITIRPWCSERASAQGRSRR